MKKNLVLFLVTLLIVAACQEPEYRNSPVSKESQEIEVEPDGKSGTSSRSGLIIQHSYWNFYRGNNDGLWYNYSANGTSWSSSLNANSGALLDQAPQAIFFNDRLVVVHRGRYSNDGGELQEIFLTYSDDGVNWTQIQVPSSTTSTPALAVLNNTLYIYSTQAAPPFNYGTVFQSHTTDLTNWNSSIVSGVEGNMWNYGLSAAVDNFNRIHLFYHYYNGSSFRMRSISSNDGVNFGGFNHVFRDYGSSTGVDNDAVAFNGSIALVYRGASNSVRVIPNIITSPTISYAIPSASTSRGPSITTYSGRLLVTYKGNSTNNMWFSSSINGGVNWTPQTTHPGASPSGPDVTAYGAR